MLANPQHELAPVDLLERLLRELALGVVRRDAPRARLTSGLSIDASAPRGSTRSGGSKHRKQHSSGRRLAQYSRRWLTRIRRSEMPATVHRPGEGERIGGPTDCDHQGHPRGDERFLLSRRSGDRTVISGPAPASTPAAARHALKVLHFAHCDSEETPAAIQYSRRPIASLSHRRRASILDARHSSASQPVSIVS